MSFARAVAFVLDKEGGLVNDPLDAGGLSNRGIALKRHPELTAEDIRTMSVQRATSIYFDGYWTPVSGPSWPEGLDLVMLDMCVNMGKAAAVECVQRALNIQVDGAIGPQTLRAAALVKPKDLIARTTAERIKRYSKMAGWEHDGNGWTHRAVEAAIEGVTGT